jgi:ATP-binding cassette subfamily F protein uup
MAKHVAAQPLSISVSGGRIVLGKNTQIVMFDQERAGLDDDKSVFENVAGSAGVIEIGGQVIEPRAWLERFLFDTSKQRQPVGSLSGGERARVALAKLLSRAASLVSSESYAARASTSSERT